MLKSEKALYIIITVVAVILFVLMLVGVSYMYSLQIENEPTKYVYVNSYITETQIVPDITTEMTSKATFLVKEHMGRIGVYCENKLLDVIDIYTKTLPEADRAMLIEGIKVGSLSELNALIEDYNS